MARSTHRETGLPLSEVRRAIQFDIGNAAAFALGEDYPLRVLDLDHCIDDRGNLSPLAVQIVSRAGDTYIEKSVSGHGLHVLVWRSENNYPTNPFPGLEIYGGAPRFIIMTGNLWGPIPTSRSGIQPTTGIRGGTNLTAAAENPTEPEYRLCCDDVPEEPEELDVMEEPDDRSRKNRKNGKNRQRPPKSPESRTGCNNQSHYTAG